MQYGKHLVQPLVDWLGAAQHILDLVHNLLWNSCSGHLGAQVLVLVENGNAWLEAELLHKQQKNVYMLGVYACKASHGRNRTLQFFFTWKQVANFSAALYLDLAMLQCRLTFLYALLALSAALMASSLRWVMTAESWWASSTTVRSVFLGRWPWTRHSMRSSSNWMETVSGTSSMALFLAFLLGLASTGPAASSKSSWALSSSSGPCSMRLFLAWSIFWRLGAVEMLTLCW